MIKIAVDAMGGDYAPHEIIRGSIDGARRYNAAVVLVGDKKIIQNELHQFDISDLSIKIIHTDESLIEGESPAFAIRNKSNSSIMLCVKLVRDGEADAVISAGPTGGLVASAVHILGTFEGISRPVIGGPFMGFASNTVLFDIGSNIDSRPEQLLNFAMMGTVYAENIMGIKNPTVALASIGSEEGKGNKVVREAYELFKKSGLNFIGNIEGNDIVNGKVNVVICDGFVGNILLKFSEGLSIAVSNWLEGRLSQNLPGEEKDKITVELRNCIRITTYNGVILYGVNGIICKAHGNSRAQDFSNIIAVVKNAVESDVVNKLRTGFCNIRKNKLPTTL
ncbi:MAG TPA: phosphate acyltransferase PlsX, partial [Dehalococcoidia bacterium]|nr:phosphate acyltransferase PlsX [Dehalococcoidia bacterium]